MIMRLWWDLGGSKLARAAASAVKLHVENPRNLAPNFADGGRSAVVTPADEMSAERPPFERIGEDRPPSPRQPAGRACRPNRCCSLGSSTTSKAVGEEPWRAKRSRYVPTRLNGVTKRGDDVAAAHVPAQPSGIEEDDSVDTDPAPAPAPAPAVESTGLDERDQQILAFERQWWRQAGAKEQAIRDTFGVSTTRYYQLLNALLDDPRALEHDPVVVQRLRRLRARRRR